jgi:hypothetical protein
MLASMREDLGRRTGGAKPVTETAPIRHEVVVGCGPDHAFEVFTTGMGTWWDPAYTPDPGSFSGIEVDPEGLVSLVHGPTRFPVGEVTTWQPGERFEQRFWLAMDPAHPSSVDVRFEAVDAGTRVTFQHGGWNRDNARSREKFADWPHLLARYAAAT